MTEKREKKLVLQNVRVFSKKPLFWTKTAGNVIKGALYFEKRLYSAFRNICLQSALVFDLSYRNVMENEAQP